MASNISKKSTTPPGVCSICSKPFTDPRMLACLHTFCKKCLEKGMEGKGTEESISCPTCKMDTALPEDGLKNLPQDLRRSYESDVALYEAKVNSKSDTACDQCISETSGSAISFCVTCCEFLCRACKAHHKTWRKTLKHELMDLGEKKTKSSSGKAFLDSIPHKPMFCSIHEDETLKFYCESCKVLVCRDCVVLQHAGHSYNRMEKIAEIEKADLVLLTVEEGDKARAKLEDAIASGGKAKQRVQTKQKAVDDSIAQTFKDLREHINKREEEMLAKRARISLGKATALTMQCEDLKALKDGIDETCEIIRTASKIYTPAEILSTKQIMSAKLHSLLARFKSSPLDPCRTDFIATFWDSESLKNAITAFGDVSGGSDASMSFANVYQPAKVIIGKTRKILVKVCDSSGKQLPVGGEEVKCSLTLIGSDDPAITEEVTDNGDGTYEVTIVTLKKGEHKLEIAIESRPIKLMPIILYSREPRVYTTLSSPLMTLNCSNTVYNVAVDTNGEVYAVVNGSHCVQVFDANGSMIRTIGTSGSYGSGDGQLYSPVGIAIRDGMVYITEQSNNRVSKFDISGKFMAKFGSYGSGNCQFSNPNGICFDHNGRLFVADYSNNRVSVFSSGDGTFSHSITGNGLNSPWGLAFDPSGNLHVTNYNSSCVKIFTAEGEYVSEYGKGYLNTPTGIAIDEEGYSIVADSYTNYNAGNSRQYANKYGGRRRGRNLQPNSSCYVFNPQHRKVHSVQNFNTAHGVALDREGLVYVADYNNCRVLKY